MFEVKIVTFDMLSFEDMEEAEKVLAEYLTAGWRIEAAGGGGGGEVKVSVPTIDARLYTGFLVLVRES